MTRAAAMNKVERIEATLQGAAERIESFLHRVVRCHLEGLRKNLEHFSATGNT
jgi:hypothetical protein